jgi:SAM-dependent methyltransferase
MTSPQTQNVDAKVVEEFGNEWSRFDQSELPPEELARWFDAYFGIFPWGELPEGARGFDLGCGSGRWAKLVAQRVGHLACIDASAAALAVARRNLDGRSNCDFHVAPVDAIPLEDASMDFGYSLGVLHHVPDTAAGIAQCVAKLKRGAPFLLYLYYRFDNRPGWYRRLWEASEAGRSVVSRLPPRTKALVADAIAATVYWPLARAAALGERSGRDVRDMPLAVYRDASFYTMRTDALDRFGTRLEQRFTADEIRAMMTAAGLEQIRFSDRMPYWVAVGRRA